ncbi:MAG: hypothetical protein V1717_00690, partial [Candidatus Micrarchaeota archaeon]
GESAAAQSNALSLSVEPKGGVADVEALFSPAKLASDAAITLKVNSWEKKIHLRVVSKDKLSLVEKHSPKEILALQDSKVSFALEDSLGFPVEDAVVMLNDVQAGEAAAGTYEVSLSPDFVGEAEYSISKEGFPVLAGAIPVKAPEKFVSISPAGVQVSVTGEPVSVELNLENLLNNEVSFTARVETGSSPAITSLSVSPSKKTSLKALEQKDVVLNASLQEGILPFAEKPARLQEAVSGSVTFVFTIGKFSQEERVPLNVTSSVDQKTLDDLWFLESESMEFVLSAEEPSQSKTLRIDSQSPVPLLINLNLNESGLYATPASLTVEANSFAEFNVTKTIPDEISSDCFALEKEEEQALGVVASYQGILSRKSVEVKNSFLQDENCKPSNESVELQLPFTDYLLLSGSVETKENPDGTLALRVGGKEGEVLAFDAGASVVNETNRLAVPAGTTMFLPRNRVQENANLIRVSFPLDSRMELPLNAELKQGTNGGFSIMMPRSIAVFPSQVILGSEGGNQVAVIPKNVFVEFVDLNNEAPAENPSNLGDNASRQFPTLDGKQPFVDPRFVNPMPFDGLSLSLPTELLLYFPAGSEIVDPSLSPAQDSNLPGFHQYYSQFYPQDVRGVYLPPATKFAFKTDSSLTDTGSGVEALVPVESEFYVPQGIASVQEERIEVTFPVASKLRFDPEAVLV